MNRFLIQLVFMCFAITNTPASIANTQDTPQLNADVSAIHTSDDISQNQIDILYNNHRRDLFYPYENEAEEGRDWGIHSWLSDGKNSQYNYTGVGLQLLLGRKFSKTANIEALVGFHQLTNTSTNSSKLVFSAKFAGFAILNEVYTTSLELSHELLNGALIQTGQIGDQFTALSMKPTVRARWSNNWQSQLGYQFQTISDNNQKSQIDVAALYGISTGTPWIWAGLGAQRLTFLNTASYWSPSEFISYGPRLEATIPIAKNISIGGGLNINRLYDKDSDTWGNGHYFSGRIQYGNRNEFNLSVYLIDIESIQNGNKWTSSQAGLNASVPF